MDDPSQEARDTRLSLVWALQSRDEAAWDRFVKLYGPLIYVWCRRTSIRPHDAGDLLQEILLKTWQGIGSFEFRETGSFRGWLRVITRNALLDYFRKNGTCPLVFGGDAFQTRLEQIPAAIDESTQLLGPDLRRLATRALDLLENEFPPESRQLFELTVIQSLSAPEAAEQLGITPGAVRKAKSRLFRRLREILGDP